METNKSYSLNNRYFKERIVHKGLSQIKMKKLLRFIENKMVRPMEKISSQRHLAAVRDGLLAVFPLTLIGSIFYLITVLPFPDSWALQKFITANTNTIMIPYRMTVVLVTLYMVVGVGANLAKSYSFDKISGSLVSLAAFLMTTLPMNPASMIPTGFIQSAAQSGLDVSWFQNIQDLGWVMPQTPMSGIGIYIGAFSAILGVETMRFTRWVASKNKKAGVWDKTKIPEEIIKTIDTIIPILIVVVVLFVVRDVIGFDFQSTVLKLFDMLIRSSSTFSGAMLYVLMLSLFTFFGIVGFGVSGSAAGIAWTSLIAVNSAAHIAGTALPTVATLPFFHYFVWIGGSGAALALVVLMCFSKSRYLRKLGLTSIIPSLANINQPVLYGLPVILNPYMFIPFILAPQVSTALTYAVMKIGLVGRPYSDPSSSFPFAVGAFLSTGDWKAVILSLVNLAISVVIYYPFFKAYEKKLLIEGEEKAEKYALEEDEELKVTPV